MPVSSTELSYMFLCIYIFTPINPFQLTNLKKHQINHSFLPFESLEDSSQISVTWIYVVIITELNLRLNLLGRSYEVGGFELMEVCYIP